MGAHEFWHAYQMLIGLVNRNQTDPSTSVLKSIKPSSAPYITAQEKQEWRSAFLADFNIIKDFYLLRKKSLLTAEEQTRLSKYRAAVQHYKPERHYVEYRLRPTERAETYLSRQGKIRVLNGNDFYNFSWIETAGPYDGVVYMCGHLVPDAEKNLEEAFFKDVTYNYDAPEVDASSTNRELDLDTERDGHLLAQRAPVVETLFPKLTAYQQNRFRIFAHRVGFSPDMPPIVDEDSEADSPTPQTLP